MNVKKFTHQFLFLLNKKEKKKILFCLIFLLFTGIFEALSISLILPITNIMLNENKLSEYLAYFNIYLSADLKFKTLILYCLISIFLVYLFKNILLLLSEIFQVNFLIRSQSRIENFFYKNYIDLNFQFHKESNSSKLIQTVIGEIKSYFGRVIKQSLILINEIIVIIFITVVIFISMPRDGFILIFSITFLFFIIYYFSLRKFITNLGRKWKIAEASKLNHARQGFASIADVKVFKKESFFANLYNYFNLISLKSRKYLSIFQYLPKLLLEMIFISLFLLFLLFISNQEENISDFLPQITLIVAASFRLMPSINKLLLASQSIRFGFPVVENLQKTYIDFTSNKNETSTSDNNDLNSIDSLELKKISFNYSNKIKIIKDIDYLFQKGKLIGIKGSNGSGKSTLAYIVSGLLKPNEGKIRINDKKFVNFDKLLINNSSYLSQNLFLFDDTILSNITFEKEINDIDHKKLEQAKDICNLDEFINKFDEKMNYKIGENGENLSSGQRQRIGLARTLYFNNKIIILDEATNALDTNSEKEILEKISKLKNDKIIIIISHKKENLTFCDDVLDMDLTKVN